jgi:hypothetical protein
MRRAATLKELEAADAHYRAAREAADASSAILANPMPERPDVPDSANLKVSQKKIKALRAAVENIRSKRPA